VIVIEAAVLGVNFTEHAPAERVHDVAAKLPSAEGFAVNATVPVGTSVAPPLSETVAVQVVAVFFTKGLGVQTTAVVVVIFVIVIVFPPDGPLGKWSVSPP
jgi:hypothetical protein